MKLQVNGEEHSFAGTLTLAALIEQLGMRADRVAVELNRNIVARDRWPATDLREGDRLEIVHFVGGGCKRGEDPGAISARNRAHIVPRCRTGATPPVPPR